MCRIVPALLTLAAAALAVHDVGVTRIVSPATTLDSGFVVVPACSVYNYGDSTEASYTVRARIGSSYLRAATVTNHAPRTYRLVQFPAWISGPTGRAEVSCSTALSGDASPGNDKRTRPVHVWSWPFGQVYIKSTTKGTINGQPVRATGSGKLDTTGLWPGAYWAYYEAIPDSFHPFLTLTSGPLEPESTALNLWQLGLANLYSIYRFTIPDRDTPGCWLVRRTTTAGCTLQVRDSLFGQVPDPYPELTGFGLHVSHWAQEDSWVQETDTFALVRRNGETLQVYVEAVHIGARQRLPFPEVSKTYFPDDPDLRDSLFHVIWWGRTMPENDGRQIDAWADISGTLNGGPISGRNWGRFDTTGQTPGYDYAHFDSVQVPCPATWIAATLWKELGLAPASPRVLNLWQLSGGNYHATRSVVFSSTDTFHIRHSNYSSGTNLWRSETLSGRYSGPGDLTELLTERNRWQPLDSSAMTGSGHATARRSGGDSIIWEYSGSYDHLKRPLNLEQVVTVSLSHFRAAGGYFAFTWHGSVDSATSAIAEPRPVAHPQVLSLSVVPNPIVQAGAVSYTLPNAGDVSLKFYDATGRLVGTLAQGYMPAGKYSVPLTKLGKELKGGIYIVRLVANEVTRTVKLVLIACRRKPAGSSTKVGE